jgi:tetratricopeptide (TPR) repeat protein
MEADERAAVAHLLCGFIRGGHYDDAEALLKRSIERSSTHAPFLNLMGAVCEAQSDWRMARRYYGRAIAADRRSADAQQNMRRIFELFNFGASREPIALGD